MVKTRFSTTGRVLSLALTDGTRKGCRPPFALLSHEESPTLLVESRPNLNYHKIFIPTVKKRFRRQIKVLFSGKKRT